MIIAQLVARFIVNNDNRNHGFSVQTPHPSERTPTPERPVSPVQSIAANHPFLDNLPPGYIKYTSGK